MKKVKGLVPQCKASGVRIKKGKVVEVSDADARYLVSTGNCVYVDKADVEAHEAGKNKGLTAEGFKAK